MTLVGTANIVDQVLQETLSALMDALGNEEDEQSERDRWWAGYPQKGTLTIGAKMGFPRKDCCPVPPLGGTGTLVKRVRPTP
jgi:hypothetical protein